MMHHSETRLLLNNEIETLRAENTKLRDQRDRLIYTMLELMSDLESEIKARAEGELPRRIDRDLAIIRHARAILAEIGEGK